MKSYPIKNQVCTQKQAKKLAELLGEHAPESLYFWTEIPPNPYENQSKPNENQSKPNENQSKPNWIVIPALWKNEKGYPAYSGDELGALLPSPLKNAGKLYSLQINKFDMNFDCFYLEVNPPESRMGEKWFPQNGNFLYRRIKHGEIASHCLADLAIQGLEDGWIKKEEFRYE